RLERCRSGWIARRHPRKCLCRSRRAPAWRSKRNKGHRRARTRSRHPPKQTNLQISFERLHGCEEANGFAQIIETVFGRRSTARPERNGTGQPGRRRGGGVGGVSLRDSAKTA